MPARPVGVDHPQHACVSVGELRAREADGAVGRGDLAGGGFGRGRGLRLRLGRSAAAQAALEELDPARVDGLRIERVALADLLDDARVDAEPAERCLAPRTGGTPSARRWPYRLTHALAAPARSRPGNRVSPRLDRRERRLA
jgi:hypothetical protein